MESKLKALAIEDFIWVIYIIISISAILSNKYERNSILTGNRQSRRRAHYINETIFIVAICIYIYFLYHNYEDKNNKYYNLALFAGILFLVGGIINLYVEAKTTSDEEVALV